MRTCKPQSAWPQRNLALTSSSLSLVYLITTCASFSALQVGINMVKKYVLKLWLESDFVNQHASLTTTHKLYAPNLK